MGPDKHTPLHVVLTQGVYIGDWSECRMHDKTSGVGTCASWQNAGKERLVGWPNHAGCSQPTSGSITMHDASMPSHDAWQLCQLSCPGDGCQSPLYHSALQLLVCRLDGRHKHAM